MTSLTFGNPLKLGPDSCHNAKGRPTFLHRERERLKPCANHAPHCYTRAYPSLERGTSNGAHARKSVATTGGRMKAHNGDSSPLCFKAGCLQVALKKLSQLDFDTFYTACWLIWNCRNKLIFVNKSPSSMDLWSWAELYRLEYVEVQQRNTKAPTRLFPKWQPSPLDSIHKLNLAIS